ncbi:MAG: hypothetical protein ACK5KR_08360 [Breznakia sp.]
MDIKEFKELEDNSKYKVIKLAEENHEDSRKQKLIDNVAKEMDALFSNAKKLMQDAKDNEKMQEIYAKTKEESQKLLELSRNALQNFREDDRVQEVRENISKGFDKVISDLSKNEKVVQVGRKVDELISNDSVQDGINNIKKIFSKKESGK